MELSLLHIVRYEFFSLALSFIFLVLYIGITTDSILCINC